MILHALETAGLVRLSRDEQHNITGIIIEAKLAALLPAVTTAMGAVTARGDDRQL